MKSKLLFRLVALGATCAAVLSVPACGGGGGGGGSSGGTGAPASAESLQPVPVQLTERASGLAGPWGLEFLPDGRLLVSERIGRLRVLGAQGQVVADLAGLPAIEVRGQGGLLDVALDPDFSANGRIYFSFSEADPGNPSLNGTAVARAVLNLQTMALEQVATIWRQQPKVNSDAHFGSRLAFDSQGYLFVTLGERSLASERGFAQDLSRHHGKVVRITTDGAPAPGNPAWGAGALADIWSLGHRNAQGAAIHPLTGELWVSEHGAQGGDEINRVVAGANHGWPLASRSQEYGTLTPIGSTSLAGVTDPAWFWETIDGSAWTGGAKSSIAPGGIAFYRGTAVPQWRGNLFVTALAGQALWRHTLDGNTVVAQERLLANERERMRDVVQGPDGALYIATDSGRVLRYGP
jgi:glucose/arabinose dehydrogenase